MISPFLGAGKKLISKNQIYDSHNLKNKKSFFFWNEKNIMTILST